MTTTYMARAAEALALMLNTFRLVDEMPLRSVRQVWTEDSLERLAFDFDHISLVVAADGNDDSTEITTQDRADRDGGVGDASRFEPWNDLIGKPFGWGWVTVNKQGYCDGLLLSFDGIVPQVVLDVIASSIKVDTISAVPTR